jgi:tetratricopeptide (TPR) repeat protein
MLEWFNDADSRACLIYGDGGIGKTTLVLEFLHDVMESRYSDLSFTPELIVFYSAKQTRWTGEGIIYLKGIAPVIEEAVRQLVLAIEERLGREWYAIEGRSLIDKAATLFQEAGLGRRDVLLILDNTETLARKPSEEKDLARLITQISSRLARVIVTSRRREQIEARPIEVPQLKDDEGARLLRALGDEYGAAPLQQAGDARLRRISRDYAGRPLLMEALARYIALTSFSIDEANKKIMQDAREGLSEFLYEDAWRRISREQQLVFLILGTLGLPVTSIVCGWACGAVRIPHSIWLSAFNETYFGRMTEYGTDYDIEFGQMAVEFLTVKFEREERKTKDEVTRVKGILKKKYKELESAESCYVSDRVLEAFRTGAARAGKLAANRRQNDDAREWYKEAVTRDCENPYLFERVAWFLMAQIQDYEDAAKHAQIAIKLDSENADAYFTAGLIKYRQGKLAEGDMLMVQAQERGKPEYLCWIQKGRARVEKAMNMRAGEEQERMFEDAQEFLSAAMASLNKTDPFYDKNLGQCEVLVEGIRRHQKKYGYRHDLDVGYRKIVRQRVGIVAKRTAGKG